MTLLPHLDLPAFDRVLLYWAAVGVVSALAIHFMQLMPMSGRGDNSKLAFFGTIDKRLGWILMEVPVIAVVVWVYATGRNPVNPSIIMVGAFVAHYINRSLVFPYRIKTKGKTMPVSMMLSSILFYVINGYLIGHYFGSLRTYPWAWTSDPRFIGGAALMVIGFVINVRSDNRLIALRAHGDTGYAIPNGGMFNYVSCANYFGEVVEWVGFAVMSWSTMGAVYAAWVGLPLIAQAIVAHRWYREHFKDTYPPNRKAIIPWLL